MQQWRAKISLPDFHTKPSANILLVKYDDKSISRLLNMYKYKKLQSIQKCSKNTENVLNIMKCKILTLRKSK